MLLPFVIHIPILIIILFYYFKRQANSELNSIFWPALFFKLAAGIFIGFLYTYYYPSGGDTIIYQTYSSKINEIASSNFTPYIRFLFLNDYQILDLSFNDMLSQPRVLFMFKLMSLLNFITFNNYWLNATYLSLFSFIGLWTLGNYLINYYSIKPSSVAIGFFCFPTFVIWSSGVLKESIIIGIITLLLYWFLKFINDKKIDLLKILASLTFLYIGWQLKFYYIIILITSILFYLLLLSFKRVAFFKSTAIKLGIIFSIIFTIILLIIIVPAPIRYILDIMFISYRDMILYSKEGTYFTYENLQPELSSYLINAPKALFTGLLRPMPWEGKGLLTFLESMENLFVLFLFLGSLYQLLKNKISNLSPELVSLFFYIIISAILMAFIAPNWGTLSRYKICFEFLLIMILWEKCFPKFNWKGIDSE